MLVFAHRRYESLRRFLNTSFHDDQTRLFLKSTSIENNEMFQIDLFVMRTLKQKPHFDFCLIEKSIRISEVLKKILVQKTESTFAHPFGHYNIIKGLSRKVDRASSPRNLDSVVPGPHGLTEDAL